MKLPENSIFQSSYSTKGGQKIIAHKEHKVEKIRIYLNTWAVIGGFWCQTSPTPENLSFFAKMPNVYEFLNKTKFSLEIYALSKRN